MATLHKVVPEQAPDQPVKTKPGSATAERLTIVPATTSVEQVDKLQLRPVLPATSETIMPEPMLLRVSVLIEVKALGVKVTETWVSAVKVFKVQVVPVCPEHAPPQPLKVKPFMVSTLKITVLALENVVEQVP
jgi:hypothetical protein